MTFDEALSNIYQIKLNGVTYEFCLFETHMEFCSMLQKLGCMEEGLHSYKIVNKSNPELFVNVNGKFKLPKFSPGIPARILVAHYIDDIKFYVLEDIKVNSVFLYIEPSGMSYAVHYYPNHEGSICFGDQDTLKTDLDSTLLEDQFTSRPGKTYNDWKKSAQDKMDELQLKIESLENQKESLKYAMMDYDLILGESKGEKEKNGRKPKTN